MDRSARKSAHTHTHTTDAFEIDQILMDAWADVYKGNVSSHAELFEAFKGRNGALFFERNTEFKLEPLIGTDINATCKDATPSAAGLNQWAT